MKKVLVLGNYSGRNAGDAAILGGLLEDVSQLYPDVSFRVPTINSQFIRDTFASYRVKPISLMPWNLSVKIFGLPIIRAILNADLILITDAILFGRKLYNPLFNYLSTLALVLPLARKRHTPLVLYNVSLGPITTNAAKWCLRRVLDQTALVILRDQESAELLERLNLTHNSTHMRADCALNTIPCGADRLNDIVKKEGLFTNPKGTIGFNINSYIDAYVRGKNEGIGRERFLSVISSTVDRVIAELGVDVLFIVTQHMDIQITREVIERISQRAHVKLVSNHHYSYRDLTAILSRLELHVGMRTHSLILAASQGVPVVGIIAYPKNRGFLRSIDQEQNAFEFHTFTAEKFFALIARAWEEREEIRAKLAVSVEREKQKTRNSATLLAPFLNLS